MGRSIEILDAYEWLPGHGENSVKVRTEGSGLIVTVKYDGGAEVCERELRFTLVCSFYSQAFPGPSMLGIEKEAAALLLRGVLVEYPDSKAARGWVRHFQNSKPCRHYEILFLAENL